MLPCQSDVARCWRNAEKLGPQADVARRGERERERREEEEEEGEKELRNWEMLAGSKRGVCVAEMRA